MFQAIVSQIVAVFIPYKDIAPKLWMALVILILGWVLALIAYSIILWLIRKLGIERYIQKFSKWTSTSENPDIATAAAKSIAVFIFILVLRKVVMYLWFYEVENFLTDTINYLPSLFVAILIGFFGIRFSQTVYSIVKRTAHFSDRKTANTLAYLAKIVVLFFTLMIALHYIKIVDDFIINTVLVGFIGMVALAGGIAFGLGGRVFAEEILGSLKNEIRPVYEEKIKSSKK